MNGLCAAIAGSSRAGSISTLYLLPGTGYLAGLRIYKDELTVEWLDTVHIHFIAKAQLAGAYIIFAAEPYLFCSRIVSGLSIAFSQLDAFFHCRVLPRILSGIHM